MVRANGTPLAFLLVLSLLIGQSKPVPDNSQLSFAPLGSSITTAPTFIKSTDKSLIEGTDRNGNPVVLITETDKLVSLAFVLSSQEATLVAPKLIVASDVSMTKKRDFKTRVITTEVDETDVVSAVDPVTQALTTVEIVTTVQVLLQPDGPAFSPRDPKGGDGGFDAFKAAYTLL